MRRIFAYLFLILLSGCALGPATVKLATLPKGCTAPGNIIRAELPQPKRGYPYTYRVYLPPCFSAESKALYPVLYLVPGEAAPQIPGSTQAWLESLTDSS